MHLLHDIADEAGAILKYNCRVTEVNLDENTIKLENGQTFSGDIIVGADGSEGITRSMFEESQDQDAILNVYRYGVAISINSACLTQLCWLVRQFQKNSFVRTP